METKKNRVTQNFNHLAIKFQFVSNYKISVLKLVLTHVQPQNYLSEKVKDKGEQVSISHDNNFPFFKYRCLLFDWHCHTLNSYYKSFTTFDGAYDYIIIIHLFENSFVYGNKMHVYYVHKAAI